MEHKQNCLVCGENLKYFTAPQKLSCLICGNEFETTVVCQNGHYICDTCHAHRAVDLIGVVCTETASKNPFEIMQALMKQTAIHMHGPEHHTLVGAALLSAYRNCGGEIDLEKAIKEMQRRGQQVPGGVCGFWGCCGAAISTGIFISIITDATPLKQKEWQLSNLMTAQALQEIAVLGGPRCCKRDSFTAVREAVAFVKEYFDLQMELPEKICCAFSSFNEQCKRKACPYYPS